MPSTTDQSADKRHKDSTGGDGIMGSNDIDLDCNVIVVVVEDSNEQFTGSISEDLEWIHINSIILKKSDKELVLNGKRLSDMHINAAQKILSQQFPSISGFDSTLKQRCMAYGSATTYKFFSAMIVIELLQAQWSARKESPIYLIHCIVTLMLFQRRLLQVYFMTVT